MEKRHSENNRQSCIHIFSFSTGRCTCWENCLSHKIVQTDLSFWTATQSCKFVSKSLSSLWWRVFCCIMQSDWSRQDGRPTCCTEHIDVDRLFEMFPCREYGHWFILSLETTKIRLPADVAYDLLTITQTISNFWTTVSIKSQLYEKAVRGGE